MRKARVAILHELRCGLLGPHFDDFAALLVEQGYCQPTVLRKVQLADDLIAWLARRRIALQSFDEDKTAEYLKARWRRVGERSGDRATLALLLRWLRQSNVIPAPRGPAPTQAELIIENYRSFLLNERALACDSVKQYLPVVRRFLLHRFADADPSFKQLTARDIVDFVSYDAARRGRRSAQLMTTVLRSFLDYLLREGRTRTNLAAAVPTIAGWRLSELPRFLEPTQVERTLLSCDRRTKTGKRDYAILLLLARLGLRAGEVAFLNLEDINWTAGELRIRGKGSRVDRLPLPQDVGAAIANYLKTGRPRCSSRRVFIQAKAPYVGFANPPNGICCIVRSALDRAGIESRHKGAHLLRHSLATRMLGHGASLAQIGQVLRHEQADTTEIYAKVNLTALRSLAQPWPGGLQ